MASLSCLLLVSIHASAREATGIRLKNRHFSKSFNPRLRTGGDLIKFVEFLNFDQFQSTPPHGRRRRLFFYWICSAAFQSTPPHGRRPQLLRLLGQMQVFQSTPPHGRRPMASALIPFSSKVSIHASAREATPPAHKGACRRHSFNPRLRTGGDSMLHSAEDCPPMFQSTPPHGRRLRPRFEYIPRLTFQSTPPHGRRPSRETLAGIAKSVSIHASAREATKQQITSYSTRTQFQSTPPHGRRRLQVLTFGDSIVVSIHASAREATK